MEGMQRTSAQQTGFFYVAKDRNCTINGLNLFVVLDKTLPTFGLNNLLKCASIVCGPRSRLPTLLRAYTLRQCEFYLLYVS